MYNKLKQLIENHNDQYQKLNDIVHSIEKDPNKDKTELELWQETRWQFIHNYASFLHDFLWEHMKELTPEDLSALDLVPYMVWNKMYDKSHIVVETIQKIHDGR